MGDLTNLFSTDFIDISQVECNIRELESNIKKLKDRIKELESEDRGLYIGYIDCVVSERDYDEEEYREYHIFGDMTASEAREKLTNIDIGYSVYYMYSMDVIKLPEDIFNLFKVWQQLTKFKQKIDECTGLPELDNLGNIYLEPFGNARSIVSGLEEKIKKVHTEIKKKMKAQDIQFDDQATICCYQFELV